MPGSELIFGVCAAALGLGRWSVELLTIAEYSGLDNAMQHLAMFKLAQLVRAAPTWPESPHSLLYCRVASSSLSQPAACLNVIPLTLKACHLAQPPLHSASIHILWFSSG